MAMQFETEAVVNGVTFFNGVIDGKELDSGTMFSGEVTTCIEAKNFALALEEATKQEPNFALIGYRLTNLLLDAD